MPLRPDQGFFIEHTPFSLLLARTSGTGRNRMIEELREITLTDKAKTEAPIRTTFPEGNTPLAVASIRPHGELHLATVDEAKRHTTPAAVQKFGRDSTAFAALVPGFFATAAAREGAG